MAKVKPKSRMQKANKGNTILLICFLILLFLCCLSPIGFFSRAFGGTYTQMQVVVKKGDTLWGLAEKYGTKGDDIRKTIYRIKKANNITNLRHIQPGELLIIPN